ncbi:hypothetical protein GCM10028803_00170 [Larkinella knui]
MTKISKTKAKIDIYDTGRVFFENTTLTTMQILTALDVLREAMRQTLVGKETEPTPELAKRMGEHTLKGRYEFYAVAKTEPINEESSADPASPTDSVGLPDGKENTPECPPVDGHDLRDEDGNGNDSERFSDRPDGDGHDADLPDGASGPGNGDADQDANRNLGEGGL